MQKYKNKSVDPLKKIPTARHCHLDTRHSNINESIFQSFVIVEKLFSLLFHRRHVAHDYANYNQSTQQTL